MNFTGYIVQRGAYFQSSRYILSLETTDLGKTVESEEILYHCIGNQI